MLHSWFWPQMHHQTARQWPASYLRTSSPTLHNSTTSTLTSYQRPGLVFMNYSINYYCRRHCSSTDRYHVNMLPASCSKCALFLSQFPHSGITKMCKVPTASLPSQKKFLNTVLSQLDKINFMRDISSAYKLLKIACRLINNYYCSC